MPTLTIVIDGLEPLRALVDNHLSQGRAYVLGEHDVSEGDPCELVVAYRGRALRLPVEVVHVRREDPGRGVGVFFSKSDPAIAAVLRAFVAEMLGGGDAPAAPELEPVADGGSDDAAAEAEDRSAGEGAAETEGEGESADESEEDPDGLRPDDIAATKSVQDRVRGLTGAEQLRLAAGGSLTERTVLERLYGPTVWETLLRNPRLTMPEAARIAKKGSLPRPLVDLIASNPTWLAAGEVQRALLSNPRSSPMVIQKVFRVMARHDMLMVPQQTAYPESVRAAAKKRLGR